MCNAGYVREGGSCVPEVADPRPLITDLIAYYLEALWERTIVGTGGAGVGEGAQRHDHVARPLRRALGV